MKIFKSVSCPFVIYINISPFIQAVEAKLAEALAEIQALKEQQKKGHSTGSGTGMLVTPSPRKPVDSTQKPGPQGTRSEGGTPNGTPSSTALTTPSPASAAAAKVEGDQQGGAGQDPTSLKIRSEYEYYL